MSNDHGKRSRAARSSSSFMVCFGAMVTGSWADAAPDSAIEIGAAYTADVWHNARGGLRRGTAYLDNLDLTLAIDGERTFGVPGLTLFAHGLYNNDRTFSDRYVGDAMVVSNIDTDGTARLYEAWADWRFGPSASFSLRGGLYDLNSEFDATEARSLFIHSSHGIGHEFAQTGLNGPSIFPSTSLAARLDWSPSDRLTIRFAVLDGVPGDPDDADRFGIALSGNDGALLVGEIAGALSRAHVSVGHWSYTAEFEDLTATDIAGAALSRDDNRGTYVNVELPVGEPSGERRHSTFARAGIANGRINAFDRYFSAGWMTDGLTAGGRATQFGFALAATRTSKPYRDLQSSAGIDTDDYEYNVELTWRLPLTEWLVVQPDLQYVINPGADASLDDALAIGLRFELAGAWGWGS